MPQFLKSEIWEHKVPLGNTYFQSNTTEKYYALFLSLKVAQLKYMCRRAGKSLKNKRIKGNAGFLDQKPMRKS